MIGCGKDIGKAFDNPYMTICCGDEIFAGETAGLIIKLCDKCKKNAILQKGVKKDE